MYRVTFTLLFLGILSCLGFAAASGPDGVADTVLDLFQGNYGVSEGAPMADLTAGRSQNKERQRFLRSTNTGGDLGLSAGFFSEIFDMAMNDIPSDISASLAFEDMRTYAQRNFRFAAGSGYSSLGGHEYSSLSGSYGTRGGGGPGSYTGGAGSGGSGGPGSYTGGAGSGGGVSYPSLPIQASLPIQPSGRDYAELPDAVPGPGAPSVLEDSPGVLPQIDRPYEPQKDLLADTPIEELIPQDNPLDNDVAAVANPEPATLILGALGLAFLVAARRRGRVGRG